MYCLQFLEKVDDLDLLFSKEEKTQESTFVLRVHQFLIVLSVSLILNLSEICQKPKYYSVALVCK